MPPMLVPARRPRGVCPPVPALQSRPTCPACGRRGAVVFCPVHTADTQLVCLDCCPKVAPSPPATVPDLQRAYNAVRRAERARDDKIAESLPYDRRRPTARRGER